MKKSPLPLAAVIIALVATSAGVLALTGGGSLRSDEGIDPNECNLVHDIDACDQDDLDRLGDGSSATNDTPPIRSDGGVEALQIDGVWVFQHQPEIAGDALHGGTPEIVDGCLVVDNTIVVWHVDRVDEATEAIAAVKAGESPQLIIGGGGISVGEGARPDQIPTVIADRCPTSAVWFGVP